RRRLAPFTRCVQCNGRLIPVTKDEVIDHLEPLTRRYYDDFSRCAEGGRVSPPGSGDPAGTTTISVAARSAGGSTGPAHITQGWSALSRDSSTGSDRRLAVSSGGRSKPPWSTSSTPRRAPPRQLLQTC